MYKAGAQETHVNSFMAAGFSSTPSFLLLSKHRRRPALP